VRRHCLPGHEIIQSPSPKIEAKRKLNEVFEYRLTMFGGEVALKNYEMKILSII
jgi:hypothetical protein